MSNLFPVKVIALVTAVLNVKDVPGATWCTSGHAELLAPQDGKTRWVLCSPEVHRAISTQKGEAGRTLRKRLAIPEGFSENPMRQVGEVTFELFDTEGLLVEATPLSKLDENLSNAVQVEMMSWLLKHKGFYIPMM